MDKKIEPLEAVFLTKQLVRLDSSKTDERKVEQYLKEILQQYAPNAVLTESKVLPNRYNLMAELVGNEKEPALIFICHMDTVSIGEGWTKDPFGAEEENGRIYGRGACDMKSGLACAVSAFCHAAQQTGERKCSLKLICTVDEEDFMRGVEKAIEDQWVHADDWVLDTEPTNQQIQVAHKGRTWFEVSIAGVTAHASTPWKGADAIAGMAEVIHVIREKIKETPEHQELGMSTVTFGQIEGGYRPYVVPDFCKVWIDMRLVPPVTTTQAETIVKEAIAYAEKTVIGVHGSYEITGDRPYVEKDENSVLLKELKKAADTVTGKDTKVSYFTGYTDTAVIAGKLQNHNCMSYGAGNLEVAHKPDEWVAIEDILRCEQVLKQLVDNRIMIH